MNRTFLLNIFLALVWTFMQGELQGSNFVVGLILGYVVIAAGRQVIGSTSYVQKVRLLVPSLLFAIWEIFTASLTIARLVIQPRLRLRPAIVAVPLDAQTDLEITAVSNFLTLSPGSLALDVSTDRQTLYVHVMDITDAETYKQEFKEGLERRILRVMR